MHNPCAVIPVYNHETAVPAVVDALLAARLPCVLVDDASSPARSVARRCPRSQRRAACRSRVRRIGN